MSDSAPAPSWPQHGPRFEVSARHRLVDVLAPETAVECSSAPGVETTVARPVPSLAVVAECAELAVKGALGVQFRAHSPAGPVQVQGWWDRLRGGYRLEVTVGGTTRLLRSLRHGVRFKRPDALALVWIGGHVVLFERTQGKWAARARTPLPSPRAEFEATVSLPPGSAPASSVQAGAFGQLGLRDIRFVTTAAGTPVVTEFDGERHWLLSATSAGPGFFETGHTSVWALRVDAPAQLPWHLGDLWFAGANSEMGSAPDEVRGHHAVHVVFDKSSMSWIVAASTWATFDLATNPQVECTLSALPPGVDLLERLRNEKEVTLAAAPWTVPVGPDEASVGVWDPHLLHDGESWWVGFVSASAWFDFHPVLARGTDLSALEWVASASGRNATEGTTLVRTPEGVRVLASDGRDSSPRERCQYPVLEAQFDGVLTQVGTLAAPYLSNIPWPSVAEHESNRLWVSFDDTRAGGNLLGYGTHGDMVVMEEVPEQGEFTE